MSAAALQQHHQRNGIRVSVGSSSSVGIVGDVGSWAVMAASAVMEQRQLGGDGAAPLLSMPKHPLPAVTAALAAVTAVAH